MTYGAWFRTHGEKHRKIMEKLRTLSNEEVIAYFRFENMVEKEPDFCPLYAEPKKCHEMEILNCYLCACPYFRFDDDGLFKEEGRTHYSSCSIDAKEGKQFVSDTAVHQDCSSCLLPHKESFIRKVFKRDWFEIMKESNATKS
ncbi:hypothetical protein [Sulfurovum riftiae]|uniref:Cysteine-rich small domain-containing protein n=1 Tax=Sulfurovum riftiae TaxID=1630136 RepID=A0A151CJ50_9BACT|nr:hypothetical protein [Sulfurovum riftiae]KYJ87568.1 hypothetical protein AS592_10725 [Sulfurovum riftiae]